MAKIKLKGIPYEVKKNKKGDVVIDRTSNKWRMNLSKDSGVKTISEGVKESKAFAKRFMDEKGQTYGNPPKPISEVKKTLRKIKSPKDFAERFGKDQRKKYGQTPKAVKSAREKWKASGKKG